MQFSQSRAKKLILSVAMTAWNVAHVPPIARRMPSLSGQALGVLMVLSWARSEVPNRLAIVHLTVANEIPQKIVGQAHSRSPEFDEGELDDSSLPPPLPLCKVLLRRRVI